MRPKYLNNLVPKEMQTTVTKKTTVHPGISASKPRKVLIIIHAWIHLNIENLLIDQTNTRRSHEIFYCVKHSSIKWNSAHVRFAMNYALVFVACLMVCSLHSGEYYFQIVSLFSFLARTPSCIRPVCNWLTHLSSRDLGKGNKVCQSLFVHKFTS